LRTTGTSLSNTNSYFASLLVRFYRHHTLTALDSAFDVGVRLMILKKAVILTAIPCEYSAVRKRLSDCVEAVHPSGSVYEVGQFDSWSILICEIGAGNERAAAEAERAIEYFKPHVVLFVGVAGGIKDVALGDVVCATKIYGYESGKDKVEFLPRPDVQSSEYPLISRARAESRKVDWHDGRHSKSNGKIGQPSVHVAPIAAGSKVVASKRSATAKFLRANYSDAVAVEMEGIGFLTATSMSTACLAMVVRGISDLIDKKSSSDGEGWQEIAADHASAFAFQMLSRIETEILLHP